MSSRTLIKVFGHIVFSFTRDVTKHYNPEEPEFTAESLAIETHQNIAVMAVWKKEKGKNGKKIGKMEKTHFGCYSKSRSIGNLDDTPPLGNCTWALL